MSDYEDVSDSIYDYQPFSKNSYEEADYDYPEEEPVRNTRGKSSSKKAQKSKPRASAEVESFADAELRMKAEELARREAELEQREMSIANREDVVSQALPVKNWPRCYPIVDHSYHSIPTWQRRAVAWIGYVIFFLFSLVLFFNVLTSLITLFSPAPSDEDRREIFNRIRYVIFSLLIFVVGVPTHFALSYWPLYKAMRHGNVARYCIFFIGYAIPIAFCLFAIAGLYEYGVGGIYVLILYRPTAKEPSYLVFLPHLLLTFLWIIFVIVFVVIYITTLVLFRKQKHTLKDVQQLASESTREAVSAVTSRFGQAAMEQAFGRNRQ